MCANGQYVQSLMLAFSNWSKVYLKYLDTTFLFNLALAFFSEMYCPQWIFCSGKTEPLIHGTLTSLLKADRKPHIVKSGALDTNWLYLTVINRMSFGEQVENICLRVKNSFRKSIPWIDFPTSVGVLKGYVFFCFHYDLGRGVCKIFYWFSLLVHHLNGKGTLFYTSFE